MRRMIVAGALAVSVALTGCGGEGSPGPTDAPTPGVSADPSAESNDVRITFKATWKGDQSSHGSVEVAGQATLPDGALLGYSVVSGFHGGTSGFAKVNGGRFSFIADLRGFADIASQIYDVTVVFQTKSRPAILRGETGATKRKQPQAIVERYGKNGQHITGPQAQTSGGVTTVEAYARVSSKKPVSESKPK